MMIFDGFPAMADAEAFAIAARMMTGEPSLVVTTQDDFDRHEVFPYELAFPVVLTPRLRSIEAEAHVEELVTEFHGEFAGT